MKIKHLTQLIFSLLLITITSCQSKGRVFFFIENESAFDSLIVFQLLIDSELILEDTVRNSSITPNFYEYQFELEKGKSALKLQLKGNDVNVIKEIVLLDELYVIAGYQFAIKPHAMYEMELQKFRAIYPISDYPNMEFTYDSIKTPKSFQLHVTDERPTLY